MKRVPYKNEELAESTNEKYNKPFKYGYLCMKCGRKKQVPAWKFCQKCGDA